MKMLVTKISMTMNAVLFIMGVSLLFTGESKEAQLYGFGFICWSLLIGHFHLKDMKEWKKVTEKKFSLIELVVVITIMSILLTIGISALSADQARSDTITIMGELKLTHTKAISEKEVTKFELSEIDYGSEVTIEDANGPTDLYFNATGEPVAFDPEGNQYALVGLKVIVNDGKQEPYIIKIKPFTGKVTLY